MIRGKHINTNEYTTGKKVTQVRNDAPVPCQCFPTENRSLQFQVIVYTKSWGSISSAATCSPRTSALVASHIITVRAQALAASGWDHVPTQSATEALTKPKNIRGGVRLGSAIQNGGVVYWVVASTPSPFNTKTLTANM